MEKVYTWTALACLHTPRRIYLFSSHRRFTVSAKAAQSNPLLNLSPKIILHHDNNNNNNNNHINNKPIKQNYYIHKISPDFASNIRKQLSVSEEDEGFITPCYTASSIAPVGLSTNTEALVNSLEATVYGVLLFLGIAAASIFMLGVYFDYQAFKFRRDYGGQKIDYKKVDERRRKFTDMLEKSMKN